MTSKTQALEAWYCTDLSESQKAMGLELLPSRQYRQSLTKFVWGGAWQASRKAAIEQCIRRYETLAPMLDNRTWMFQTNDLVDQLKGLLK